MMRIILVAVAAVALIGVLAWSVVLAVMMAFGASADGVAWPLLTGPVGDTFGGLLGPILNAAVLAATVFLAVSWQPRKEERDRAANIVGWIAETEGGHLGVVVANTSGSVASMVDVVVQRSGDDTPLIDREATVPPGLWFIPFATVEPLLKVEWKLPLSVDTSRGMTVTLRPSEVTEGSEGEDLLLRPHLPQTQAGRNLPHFEITELRYTVGRRTWSRDRNGALWKARKLSEEDEAARTKAMRSPRASVTTMSARVSAGVEQLLRYTIDALCSDSVDSAANAFAAAASSPQPVSPVVLPGVKAVSRNAKNGGTLTLHLDAEGRQLRLWQTKEKYPGGVEVVDSAQQEVRAGDKKVSSLAQLAGARVLGKKNMVDLARDAGEWMQSPGWRALWIIALREMVVTASQPVEDAPAAQAVDADQSAAEA